jgi:ADP-ribosylglycohydrolase
VRFLEQDIRQALPMGRFDLILCRNLAFTYFENALQAAIARRLVERLETGGDADTMACIAGGVAEAFYGAVPELIAREVSSRLPEGFRNVLDRFESRYGSATANPSTG